MKNTVQSNEHVRFSTCHPYIRWGLLVCVVAVFSMGGFAGEPDGIFPEVDHSRVLLRNMPYFSRMASQTGAVKACEVPAIDPLKRPHNMTNVVNRVFLNKDCQKTNSCDLTQFQLVVSDYNQTWEGGPAQGSQMYASYRTRDVSQLTQFGIVQFIRGCMYYSQLKEGKLIKRQGPKRILGGHQVLFHHPDWVIDATGTDPMYWSGSDDGLSRHHLYQWKDPSHEMSDVAYGTRRPSFPELFVSDRPTTAFSSKTDALNVSLEFRTCIYRTRDIPRRQKPQQVQMANPIHCEEWRSSHIYSFKTGRFESPPAIDPFCLTR